MPARWGLDSTLKKRIWGVKCGECKKRLFSFHVHDYKLCGCPNETMVDGGRDYLRYGWIKIRPTRIYWSVKQDGQYPKAKVATDRWPY